ncbi:MAG TPA: YraN family protein [Chitinophagaceae bacterium]|jgi:putative endonuclease|nr:YraN family protein [Chitinophagaceae bacterium]
MAVHNQLGRQGEEMARAYLVKHGYEILYQNWRYSHYEIDIVAIKKGILHIVEVKIRSSQAFGYPEESVTRKKFKALLKAADEFLFQNQQYRHVQYDILSITTNKSAPPDYFLIEDVYL